MQDLTRSWREIFVTAYTGAAHPALPPIERNDVTAILRLFNGFHELRDGDAGRRAVVFPALNSLARAAGLDERALALLPNGDDADKILALDTLGHLRDERALEPALPLMEHGGPELSRSAAQCAVRIEPRFIDTVLEYVRDRNDWVRSRIETMLKEIEPDVLDAAMARVMHGTPQGSRAGLLDYVRFCSPAAAREICCDVLASTTDTEAIAAALRSLAPIAQAGERTTALRYCNDASPIVLLAALRVLRKCAIDEDRALLARLTSHSDYWVRLRSAEVVVSLYGDARAQAFALEQSDRFARDAVRQAIAENRAFARRTPRTDRRARRIAEGRPLAIGGGPA